MEKRAWDLQLGERYRQIGDLDARFLLVDDLIRGPGDRIEVRNKVGTFVDSHGFDRDEVVEVAERYLVSFGSVYKYEPHPVLGYWPELGEDAVLEVWAESELGARTDTYNLIGPAWCAIYGPTEPPGWDYKNLGLLVDAVAEPRHASWTVGVQLTVNADGTLELHLGDVPVELDRSGAPAAVIAAFDEVLSHSRPSVRWVPRG
jgi:hypothetical protein